MNLPFAQRMLPLVRQIVSDIVGHRAALDRLGPREEHLTRYRSELVWQERQHLYTVREDIDRCARGLKAASAELKQLGVVLHDAAAGRVGFPTQVDGEKAFFSWQSGETDIGHWHFADEKERRAIPPEWHEQAAGRLASAR